MKLYDTVSTDISRTITRSYSTSFSAGVKSLSPRLRGAIYSIYGLVRVADEIVDTFEDCDREALLRQFIDETWQGIQNRVSTNPVIHAFQKVYHKYNINPAYLESFFYSMEMDLKLESCSTEEYETYIDGSAECVGLMCLCVFCHGNTDAIKALEHPARVLGSAFQKVNFLRDLREDLELRGRFYFPGSDAKHFDDEVKREIEAEIQKEFDVAYEGIIQLPASARTGVYLAFSYYQELLSTIKHASASELLQKRIRVPDWKKLVLMFKIRLKKLLFMGPYSFRNKKQSYPDEPAEVSGSSVLTTS